MSLTADPTPDHPTPPDARAVVLVVVGFGAIALRRRFPGPVLAVVSVATIAYLVRDYPDNGLPVMALIALYTVASLRRRAVWATASLVYLALLLLAAVTSPDELSVGDFIGNIAVYGIAAVLGDERLADTRVIVLTTFDLDEYVFDALRARASGFLLKDTDPTICWPRLAVAGSLGIISAIEGDRPIPLVVPPMQLTVIVVLASVAGVLAAVGPARRAAKLDILAAIASQLVPAAAPPRR